jgi:hypothetical protein
MDFGGPYVEIDAQPLTISVDGGIFADYTELAQMTSGPPKIFEEDAGKEVDDAGQE